MIQEAAVYRAEGRRLQEMGRAKDALAVYQKAVAVDPNYAEAYNDMGVMFETLGQDEKAQQAYESALSLDPDLAAAHSNLALLFERTGKVKEAAQHWAARARMGLDDDAWAQKARRKLLQYGIPIPETEAELQKKREASIRLAYEAGLDQMEAKEWALAAKEFERVLALDPAHPKAAEKLRSVRAKEKEMASRRAQAIELTIPEVKKRAAIPKEPVQAQAVLAPVAPAKIPAEVTPLLSEAQVLAQALAKEKAKTRQLSVQEIYQRGVAAMRERNFEEAVTHFEQVLSLDPNHQDAQLALKRAQAALSKATQTKP